MKYVLEFGVRGGAHTDNVVLPSRKLAESLACRTVQAFTNSQDVLGTSQREWMFCKGVVRLTWRNRTHFVAVSVLDGVDRGPAAPKLWPKQWADGDGLPRVVSHYS